MAATTSMVPKWERSAIFVIFVALHASYITKSGAETTPAWASDAPYITGVVPRGCGNIGEVADPTATNRRVSNCVRCMQSNRNPYRHSLAAGDVR